MSLAATLAADGMRPASFLPAIKCSDCGEEIEIARMGDHVCSSRGQEQYQHAPQPRIQHARPAPPPLMTNPYTMPSWAPNNQQYQPASPTSQSPVNSSRMPTTSFAPSPLAQTQSSPQVPRQYVPAALQPGPADSLRATKLPLPPRINPDAANKPFLAPSYPRSASPSSPVLSVRSGRSGSSNGSRPPILRNINNMPSPLVRNRSPSPDLASNLDCAFPSFPTSSSNSGSRPGTSNGRKTPNSDRAPSRSGSRAALRPGKDLHASEPRSPMTAAGDSIMKRANTLKSGPFDAGRRMASRDEHTGTLPILPISHEQHDLQRRPSNFSDRSMFHTRDLQEPEMPKSRDESPPPPAEFFERRGRSKEFSPSKRQESQIPAPLRLGARSKTFPTPDDEATTAELPPNLSRMPSEPSPRGRERRPSTAASMREQSRPRATNFPVRSSSRSRTRAEPLLHDAPPVPKPVQHYRHLSKHAPSESASSASSTSRSYSNANSSEGPSPVGSAASSIDAFSPISQANLYDKDDRPKSERMRSAGYSTKREQQNPGLRAEQPAQRSPPPNFARPRLANTNPPASHGVMQSMAALMDTTMDKRSSEKRVEAHRQDSGWEPQANIPSVPRTVSPIKHGLSPPPPEPQAQPWAHSWGNAASDDYDPYRAHSPNPATRARSKSNASSIYPSDNTFEADVPPSIPVPPIPANAAMQGGLQRRNTSVRPPCRGCKQIIEGKSVKAADGRLTGRWHKHCFTCQTCRQPFATADFYVINDQPYCKQHYHEQNGSLCFGCKRGIEGQYLETSASGPEKKYHPTCFTCHECRLILSNDYFEINGQAYCERHALVAMRGEVKYGGGAYNRGGYGTPSGLHPGRRELMSERRTTKLMMM